MNEPRSSFTLTALANGKVLAVGGNYADVYDPAQDFFINSLTLANPRARHVAVRLADNRVLIAGGDDGTNPIARAELIAADGSATTPTGNMIEARTSFQATLLNNGLVLLTGSGPAGPLALATAEVYDPAGGSFLRIPAMSFARENHTATKTGDGRVLLAGGNGADGVMEWFTPSSR
jgi:hypothetical protein